MGIVEACAEASHEEVEVAQDLVVPFEQGREPGKRVVGKQGTYKGHPLRIRVVGVWLLGDHE